MLACSLSVSRGIIDRTFSPRIIGDRFETLSSFFGPRDGISRMKSPTRGWKRFSVSFSRGKKSFLRNTFRKPNEILRIYTYINSCGCIFFVDIAYIDRYARNPKPLATSCELKEFPLPSLAVFYLPLMELRNVRDKLPPRKTLSLVQTIYPVHRA